ncbi:gustatory receptor 68a-like [Schistocerca gregaria]|uniref:gustatory receptor 68a-like n=1 Tax=Schistocerca gregaria TaxID=7010 RepID=UPI00211EE943|nr:gustatory receptor 68a-like [Schistocerca gregaria]
MKYADTKILSRKKENMKMLGGFLLAANVAVTVAVVATIARKYNRPYEHPKLVFSLFFGSLMTLQFTIFELELWSRFRLLNDGLTKAVPVPLTPASLEGVSPSTSACRLRQLLEAYTSLRRAAQLLQCHFGAPVALSVAQSVCCSTCSAYEVLLTQLRPQWAEQLPLSPSVGNSLLWLSYHWLRLTMVSLSCAAVEHEAANTTELVLRAAVASEGRCADLESFLLLVTHGPTLRFSAAGFFIVNRRLLVSALAIVLTYLIILGQLTPKL